MTFGAGIAKLDAVDKLRGQRRRSFGAFALRLLSAACVCVAAGLLIRGILETRLPAVRGVARPARGRRGRPDRRAPGAAADRRRSPRARRAGDRRAPGRALDRPARLARPRVRGRPAGRRSARAASRARSSTAARCCSTTSPTGTTSRASRRPSRWRSSAPCGGHANPRRPAALAAAERARSRTICVIDCARRAIAVLVPALWIGVGAGLLGGALIARRRGRPARRRLQAARRAGHGANAGAHDDLRRRRPGRGSSRRRKRAASSAAGLRGRRAGPAAGSSRPSPAAPGARRARRAAAGASPLEVPATQRVRRTSATRAPPVARRQARRAVRRRRVAGRAGRRAARAGQRLQQRGLEVPARAVGRQARPELPGHGGVADAHVELRRDARRPRGAPAARAREAAHDPDLRLDDVAAQAQAAAP